MDIFSALGYGGPSRQLKKTHRLRCAQSPRYNVLVFKYASSLACPERKPKDRFFARLASEIFLSSLLD